MNIDLNAPLAARREITIAAPVEHVWRLQTDFESWPEWQPGVTTVTIEGPLAAGTVFRWKAKGLKIVSELQEVEMERRIGWTGISLGMQAIHNWTFEQQNGGTRVITEESLAGWFPRLLKIFDPEFLEHSLAASLETLKTKAEQA